MEYQKKRIPEPLFIFIYLIRKYLPRSCLFYCVYLIVNYLPILIITHNVKQFQSDTSSISSIFLKSTFFGSGFQKSFFSKNTLTNILFFLLILFFGFILLIIYKLKHFSQIKSENSYSKSDLDAISFKMKKCIQIISYIILGIVIVFPYLIELNSFGIFLLFISDNNDVFQSIKTKTQYLLVLANLISLILLELIMIFFFYISNSPFPHMKYANYNLNKNNITILICSSLLGVYTLLNSYYNTFEFRIIMNFIVFILLLCSIIQLFFSYNYYQNNFSLTLNVFLQFFGLNAALLDFLLFLFNNGHMTTLLLSCKLLIEIVNSYILTKVTIKIIIHRYIKGFIENVFTDKKCISINEIVAFVVLLSYYDQEKASFMELVDTVSMHKEKCIDPKCPCYIFLHSYYCLDMRKNGKRKELSTKIGMTKANINSFIIALAEFSLMKSINYLYKQKRKDSLLELLIICHVDYILGIQQATNLAFYYSVQYSHQTTRPFSFMTRYYLFEYKQCLYKEFTQHKYKNNKSFKLNLTIDNNKEANAFYSMVQCLTNMIEVLKSLCFQIDKVLIFRKAFSNQRMSISKQYSKCESFIKLVEKLKLKDEEIVQMITNHKEPNEHYEMSYLITHYFLITKGKVPKQIRVKIKDIKSISFLKRNDELLNSYEKYHMINPMILSINSKDELLITFISRRLCSVLCYTKEELINSNFEQLLPQKLGHFHMIMMKQYFLFSSFSSFRKQAFIQDKNNYIIPVNITAVSFPTIESNFNFILDIILPNPSYHRKNNYYFILNQSLQIMTANEKFKDDFFVSLEMLNLIKVSFSLFFGINEEKLKAEVENNLKHMQNKRDIEEFNRRFTIFSACKETKTVLNHSCTNDKFQINRTPEVIIERRSGKNNMIRRLQNMVKMIEDLGLDIEWFSRINALKERLLLPNVSNSFDIKLKFKSIGDIQYCVVTVSEDITNIPKYLQAFNLIQDSILNIETMQTITKRNSNELFQSISPLNKNLNTKYIDGNSSFSSKMNVKINNSSFSLLDKKDSSISSTINLLKSSSNTILRNDSNHKHNNLIIHSFNNLIFNQKKNEHRDIMNNKTLKKHLKIIYQVLCILIILLSFGMIILNNEIITLSKNIFSINTYAVLIKSGVYFIAMSILVCCDYASLNNQEALLDQRWRLEFRGSEVIKHYSYLMHSLNKLVSRQELNPIFIILSEKKDYYVMMLNFKIKTRSSTMSDEIYYLHFILKQLKDDQMFQTCRMKELFHYGRYRNLDETTPPPNLEETNVHYVITNIITTFKTNLEKLTIETNEIFQSYHLFCKETIILYNSILLCLKICFAVTFLLLLFFLRSDIQNYLRLIYIQNPRDTLLENQITQFKITLDNFSFENCENLEQICFENCSLLKNYHLFQKRKEKKMPNEKHNSVKNTKQQKETSHKQKEDDNDEQVTLIKKKYITPNILNIGVIITIILTVMFCSLELTTIFLNDRLYDELLFGNIMVLNFLDRIPKLCELLLYMRISVLENNIYHITTPQSEYELLSYSNYYKIKVNLDGNSLFQLLGDSQYSFIYYQALVINKNIELFASDSKNKNILSTTLYWENKLNTENDFCVYSTLGSEKSKPEQTTLVNVFTSVNSISIKCMGYGGGMTNTTLSSFIKFSFQQLGNIYSDFKRSDPNTRDLDSLLMHRLFKDIDQITEDTLKRVHNIILNSTTVDMNHLYSRSTNISIIFSVSLILLSLLIFGIVHLYLMRGIEKIITILNFAEKYIKKATLEMNDNSNNKN